jgi:long-chain fatty acid transport protein
LLVIFISPAFATNGYLAHGYGVKSHGMAGAGVALPQEAFIAAINPAGIVFVGDRLEINVGLFSPRRSYQVTGNPSASPQSALAPGKVDSGREYFVLPEAGATWQLNDHSAFCLTFHGNGGMNTSYSAADTAGGTGTFSSGTAGVDLAQLFLSPTFAYKLNNGVAVGVSAVLAYQDFEAKGLTNFGGLSNSAQNLTDNGHDNSFGAGINLGFILPASEQVTFGGGYRSRVYMSKFDDYLGLFANQGDMDIPASATIGLAWKTTASLTLALDLQKTWYSQIDAVGNPLMPSLQQCQQAKVAGQLNSPFCLGGHNVLGFGWKDMTTVKLGVQYEASNDWT